MKKTRPTINPILFYLLIGLFLLVCCNMAHGDLTSGLGGAGFQTITQTTIFIRMDAIQEQMAEARKASQKGLSQDRLNEIWEQTQQVFIHLRNKLFGKKDDDGSMIFCSSQVIK